MSKYAVKWILRYIRMQLDLLELFINGEAVELIPERLLTLEEVAELTYLDPGTLKNYCRDGKLPGRKIGKRWFLPENVAFEMDTYLSIKHTPQKTTKTEVNA